MKKIKKCKPSTGIQALFLGVEFQKFSYQEVLALQRAAWAKSQDLADMILRLLNTDTIGARTLGEYRQKLVDWIWMAGELAALATKVVNEEIKSRYGSCPSRRRHKEKKS